VQFLTAAHRFKKSSLPEMKRPAEAGLAIHEEALTAA
jgi:hypothetical protein